MVATPPDPNGPPGDLDTTARARYRKLREFLKGQSTWEDSDRYILGQTCRHEMMARVAYEGIPRTKAGVLILRDSGYNGQPVQHPNYKTWQAESKSFVEGLKELGLTPRARKTLEISVGQKGSGKFGGLG